MIDDSVDVPACGVVHSTASPVVTSSLDDEVCNHLMRRVDAANWCRV